jgi:hypothetical protein
MIYRDRNKVDTPTALAGRRSLGAIETIEAIAFYRRKKNRDLPFEYVVYKHRSIIAALEELFGGKCAYCESFYHCTAPADIEHFRPKGGVAVPTELLPRSFFKSKKPKGDMVLLTPGYYWLAAEWWNLLPSCIDCNRQRTHDFLEQRSESLGKANKFPLMNNRLPAPSSRHQRFEKPLLLNPCIDVPENHLEFDELGNVRAKKGSLKGNVSIQVFGLRRTGLVHMRHERAIDVLASIKRLKRAEAKKRANPKDPGAATAIKEEIETLRRYSKDEAIYAGMTRQLIEKHYGKSLP